MRKEVDLILAGIDPDEFLREGINFDDLRCTSAWKCRSDTGEEKIVIEIEEASPSAVNLQYHVAKKLKARGFGEVEVITNW